MASAQTGSFYLTETITMPAASAASSRFQGTVDLSSYVSVPSGMAISIDQVDFIWQTGADFGQELSAMLAVNGALSTQLTDQNPGTVFVRADDNSLIASGALNIDAVNNIGTHVADIYPDSFGPAALSDTFLCVNDTLFLVAGNDASATLAEISCTVRIRARIVKLSSRDWMAIAIQSTATD